MLRVAFLLLLGSASALKAKQGAVHELGKPKAKPQLKVEQSIASQVSKKALARSNLDVMKLDGKNHSFKVKNEHFVWDGKPVALQAGEVHYFRIPSKYWKDRLLRVRAMGMNAIQTYVPWNFHETDEGVYDFHSEMHDLIKFLETAKELNLPVVLRPGPYICAEWTGGGLPGWLQSKPNVQLRTYEKEYIAKVNTWWGKLLPMVQPHLAENGGPIIMVQLENEYGVLGDTVNNLQDKKYIEHLRDLAVKHLGHDVQLFTDDAAFGGYPLNEAMFKRGGIPGVFRAINLGPESINDDNAWNAAFRLVREMNGNRSPMYVAETYSGWFTKWAENRITRKKTKDVTKAMLRLRNDGASLGLYMVHGGTNFGFWAGANEGTSFITSYDYNAPIREAGDHGYGIDGKDKYYALQQVFGAGRQLPEEPAPPVFQTIGSVDMRYAAPLHEQIDKLCHNGFLPAKGPQAAEKHGHGMGLMAYRYSTNSTDLSMKTIEGEASDPMHVWADGKFMGRFTGKSHNVPLKAQMPKLEGKRGTLDIVVDTEGRANFGMEKKQMHDLHGLWMARIKGAKPLNSGPSSSWSACALRFEDATKLSEVARMADTTFDHPLDETTGRLIQDGPSFWTATIDVSDTSKDTFMHPGAGWNKGVAFINGFNLGRYDMASPQKELYVPSTVLKQGANEVLLLETGSVSSDQKMGQIDFLDQRISKM